MWLNDRICLGRFDVFPPPPFNRNAGVGTVPVWDGSIKVLLRDVLKCSGGPVKRSFKVVCHETVIDGAIDVPWRGGLWARAGADPLCCHLNQGKSGAKISFG